MGMYEEEVRYVLDMYMLVDMYVVLGQSDLDEYKLHVHAFKVCSYNYMAHTTIKLITRRQFDI